MKDFFSLEGEQLEKIGRQRREADELLSRYAVREAEAVRRFPRKQPEKDQLRPAFGIDVDKIVNNPYYNRYTDKTQVFSFYRNDDISRRALHVQLVSRIGRVIGRALGLNLDLIEAIALGHDIGHTPFGHKGEEFLSEIYQERTGRTFRHNVHSVRVLLEVTNANLTLQTYDGILCHCGEKAFDEYRPAKLGSFDDFIKTYQTCYTRPEIIEHLCPGTMEGCVVRLSDMIAYVGKDRQDAYRAGLMDIEVFSDENILGSKNSDILNNIILNVVKNSLGKPYLKLDGEVFDALKEVQRKNNMVIYQNERVTGPYYEYIRPMMNRMYEYLAEDVDRLKEDVRERKFVSPVYRYYLKPGFSKYCYWDYSCLVGESDDIVVDYMASMTDDYFLDLYEKLFPGDDLRSKIEYHPYFPEEEREGTE